MKNLGVRGVILLMVGVVLLGPYSAFAFDPYEIIAGVIPQTNVFSFSRIDSMFSTTSNLTLETSFGMIEPFNTFSVDLTPQSTEEELEGSNVQERIDFYLRKFNYINETESLTAKLLELFPSLESLKDITDDVDKIRRLAGLIVSKIRFVDFYENRNSFDLPSVISDQKASCLGYAQLVLVLGRSIGLDVSIILVPSEEHLANIVYSDSGCRIVDLTNSLLFFRRFYISSLFDINESYLVSGKCLMLNSRSKISEVYKVIKEISLEDIEAAINNNYGCISFVKKNDLIEALGYFNIACEMNPNDPLLWHNCGLVYYRLGRYEEAIQNFDKALELYPTFERALRYRKATEYKLGQSET